jgi:hypothetical protein
VPNGLAVLVEDNFIKAGFDDDLQSLVAPLIGRREPTCKEMAGYLVMSPICSGESCVKDGEAFREGR